MCSFWLTLLLFFLHPGAGVRQPRSGGAGGLRAGGFAAASAPRWAPGVGGSGGYPRMLSRVLAGTSVPILLLAPGRQGRVCDHTGLGVGTPPLGFEEQDGETWGTVLWGDRGAVLGDLGCGAGKCGVLQPPRGREGRHGVGSAGSGASLAPQCSQFNQQGTQLQRSRVGPHGPPSQDPQVAPQQGGRMPRVPHGGTAPGTQGQQ